MSRRYFPLFVDISCQKIVVIGGGQVAQRRIETLLAFGADLWVAAPEITERLKELLKARHMSRYRLSQLTGISQSSLCYLFQKKNVPGLVTLRKICDALGITLAQFFCEEEYVYLSWEQKQWLDILSSLPEEERRLLWAYAAGLLGRAEMEYGNPSKKAGEGN